MTYAQKDDEQYPALVVDRGRTSRAEIASLLRGWGFHVAEEKVAVKVPLRGMIAQINEPVVIVLAPRSGRRRSDA